MFNSTRGNSFRITKKVLCVVMAVSLSLMMLPSALFRTQAEAAPAATDDVFVKADSDMTNFGQFAYNPNSNAANISTYTQNDLLNAIGCRAETEESLHEQVANEVKAFLIENQFSPVDDVFPAAKEGYQLTGTSIASVTSQLACLTATYDKATGKAKFVTSAPANSAQNGVVIITAEYAKLVADYDIVFSSLITDLNAAKELQINTKTCEGMITITPTANKDTNGKTIYKLTVDTAIKNINKTANNLNVTVVLDNNKLPEGPDFEVINDTLTIPLSTLIGAQALEMREVSDMREKLFEIVNSTHGYDVRGEQEDYVYIGIQEADKGSILNDNAYKVKNAAIDNVNVNTNNFHLYIDEARTTLSQEHQLNITDPYLNISQPETISVVSSSVGFYDEDDKEHEFDPSSDFFPGDFVTAIGKNGNKVCKSTDSTIIFNDECQACKRPSTGTQAQANLLVKTTDNHNVVKYAEQQCNFVADSGYLGYSVEDKDDEGEQKGQTFIDDVWSFFFGQGKLKVKFRYNRSAASEYEYIKVADKDRKNLILQSTDVETTDNEKIFIAIFGDEDVGKLANLEGKYIHAYKSDSRTGVNLLTNDEYPKTIIANAPAPKSITVETSGITKDGDVVTGDVTLNIKVEMDTGEGDIFKYTVAAKGTDPIASIVDVSNPSQTNAEPPLTYADFGDPKTHTGDTWTASKKFHLEDTCNEEHDYTITVNKIVDILQRGDDAQEQKQYHFSIDKRNPSLEVVWNPVEENALNGGYFNQKRQATIIIDEMNYKEPVIEQSFNHGSYKPVVVSWVDPQPGSYIHTGTFICEAEGHYDIRIKGEDAVGHKFNGSAEEYQYTEEFTLDYTPPNIDISFDNDAVVNGMYYTGTRKATITITEVNWSDETVAIPDNPPGNDGKRGSFNMDSEWSHSGNVHTLHVDFYTEGRFTLVVNAIDLAGNTQTQSVSEFVIDWTKPTITISGVENRQAYGGNAQPTVTINDANMSSATTCEVESLGITKGHPYSTSPSASPAVYTYAYANPEAIPENDGVYRINVNAVDMAGNGDVQERVWSVNRFGSTYVIDAETETMMDGYVNNDNLKDVKVTEINPSGVETHSVDMTKDSFTETLTEGQDYTAAASGGDGTWYECLFTISKDFFKEDGKYTFNYYSKDRAGNESENTMENRNQERNAAVNVQFVLDNAKPTVSFDNLSSVLYGEAKHEATANFEDNSGKFSEAKVIINGEEHYASGDELNEKHNAIEFELNDAPVPYTIETVAIDKAGNEMDKDVRSVVVTMNPFLLWFYNTPLFAGSIAVIAVAAAGVLYMLYRRGIIFKK